MADQKKKWKVSAFALGGAAFGVIYIAIFKMGAIPSLSPSEAEAFAFGELIGGALGFAGLGALIAVIGNFIRSKN